MYAAGDGLARGYLNRADLTAERFTANPFGEGERLYRTGDLARWLPDGNIEFLGRKDEQVKIRGHRIELGEVESVIGEHPQMAGAVVVARVVGESQEKSLCGYYVSKEGLEPSALREHLKGRLPGYLVPTYLMRLEALPLTANGKVDRKRLPEPEGIQRTYVAPRNGVEEALAKIFSEVLGMERIGIEDDFFELGGHSLKAIRVVARIRKELEVGLELKELFGRRRCGDWRSCCAGGLRSITRRFRRRISVIIIQRARRSGGCTRCSNWTEGSPTTFPEHT